MLRASVVMENRIIEKYVKDLDGMLKDIKSWEEEAPLWELEAEEYIYEGDVVFAFGRLYKFLKKFTAFTLDFEKD